jgi:hypothetical protein
MELTILEDGTISISTGNMAGEHHASADEFINRCAPLVPLIELDVFLLGSPASDDTMWRTSRR